MDAFKFIKKEHDRMDKTFAEIADTTEQSGEKREELFEKLKKDLEIHMRIEEAILYPELKAHKKTEDKGYEGIAEHDVGKNLLREMDSMPKDNKEWTAKFDVLKESMEHHNKEEEDDLFPDARKVLSQEKIDEMGEKLVDEKKKLEATVV
ncbi:MAG: hemerythrin domain-containing protein [Aridibacter sp.]